MSKFGDVANAIAGSVGKSSGEMLLSMARAAYPPGHPELLFAEWMAENQGRIQAACADLGVDPPEPGPGLFQRLKEAVMPVLERGRGAPRPYGDVDG